MPQAKQVETLILIFIKDFTCFIFNFVLFFVVSRVSLSQCFVQLISNTLYNLLYQILSKSLEIYL